jgi:hypothetical protein
MDFAVHLRALDQRDKLDALSEEVEKLCRISPGGKARWGKGPLPDVSRLYLGDEFCLHRLPRLSDLVSFHRFAQAKALPITLLTPVCTTAGLKKLEALFDFLKVSDEDVEVVANDWGTLVFLRERYPRFRVATGRMLNKGFKDPRIKAPERLASLSPEAKELLTQSTYDGREIGKKMTELGVTRWERDLLPYQRSGWGKASGMAVSIYFPFGYFTSGRVCWVASAGNSAPQKFIPLDECSQPCRLSAFELQSKDFSLPVCQNGNTLFYRYTPKMVASLLRRAQGRGVRLVYQGFAF